MFLGFIISFLSVSLPPLLLVFLKRGLREKAFLYIPFGIVLNFGFIGVLSALFYRFLEFGLFKYVLILGLSALCVYLIMSHVEKRKLFPWKSIYDGKLLLLFALFALISVSDNFIILNKQGWSLEDGSSFFRAPFNTDSQRNIIIVNSLIRRGGSPFLPHTDFSYQMFWYHPTAVFLSLWDGAANYGSVQGVSLTTGLTVYFVLFWMLYVFRPAFFLRFKLSLLLFIVIVTHADIFHFLVSLIFYKRMAIGADGSFSNAFFRNFSIKLTTLTAPQHASFLVFLSLFLVISDWQKREKVSLWVVGALFLSLCLMSSPVLFIFIFPFMIAYDLLELLLRKDFGGTIKLLLRMIIVIFITVLFFWFIYGFSPIDLFIRPGVTSFNKTSLKAYFALPVLLLGTLGMHGLMASVFIIIGIKMNLKRKSYYFYVIPILIGSMLVYYPKYNTEVARHYSMIASFLAAIFIFKFFPLKEILKSKLRMGFVILSALISFSLNIYMVYSYTGKENVLSKDVNYNDYFCINDILRNKYHGKPVLAATEQGLRFPIAMEVAASFVDAEVAYVHSRLTIRQIEILEKIKIL